VIVQVVLRNTTVETYDAVRAETGWIERRPDGGLGHFTWWQGPDCCNMDAWESEQAFQRFVAERLGPAMARLGVTTQPEVTFFKAHEVFTPGATTLLATPHRATSV
jgi:hypothetical protein